MPMKPFRLPSTSMKSLGMDTAYTLGSFLNPELNCCNSAALAVSVGTTLNCDGMFWSFSNCNVSGSAANRRWASTSDCCTSRYCNFGTSTMSGVLSSASRMTASCSGEASFST